MENDMENQGLPSGGEEAPLSTEEPQVQEQEESQDQPQPQPQQELYNWGGRQLSPKELYEEAKNLQGEFTRRSQRLAELEKAREPQVQDPTEGMTPEERIAYEDAAKKLTPLLQPNIQSLVNSMVQEQLSTSLAQQRMLAEMETHFNEVESTAKKAGIPFSRAELVEYMQSTRNADIQSAFKAKYFDQLVDYNISQRNSKKKEVYTERGAQVNSQPIAQEFKSLTDAKFRRSLSDKMRKMIGAKDPMS